MHKGSDSATAASTAVQVWTNVDYSLRTPNAGWRRARTASSEAAPPRNIKYEFGMKNEDYYNRWPSCYLLTKRIGLQPDTLSLRAARIVVLYSFLLVLNRCHCTCILRQPFKRLPFSFRPYQSQTPLPLFVHFLSPLSNFLSTQFLLYSQVFRDTQ